MNSDQGEQAVRFFKGLTLIGDYSGQLWDLEPWQEALIRDLYGKRNPDGTRQHSKVSAWLPRGLGKTQLAAGFALYQLVCGPTGQEIYSVSADRDKASRVFKAMAQMARANPKILALLDISDYFLRIKRRNTTSVYQALASDCDQGHSLSPSTLVLDEIHLFRGRNLYDAMTTGFQKRKKGSRLEIQISTAGNTRTGLAWDLYSYAKNVKEKVIEDPELLPLIFECDEKEDWTKEATWRKCMPCKYVDFDFIASECRLAQKIKHKELAFRQLYLNQWIEASETTWIEPASWRLCQADFTAEDLEGETAIGSLDLSSVRDLTALSLFFPNTKRVLSWGWLPREGLAERAEKDGFPYHTMVQEGRLFLTSGSRIVHKEVADKVNEILQRYNVTALVADPYSLHLIAPYLNQEPIRYPQSPGYMSPPTKWLESAISNQDIFHDGGSLLTWCVCNTVVEKDKYENISPNKSKCKKRIDLLVALVMAIGFWLGTYQDESKIQDYDDFYSNINNLILTDK